MSSPSSRRSKGSPRRKADAVPAAEVRQPEQAPVSSGFPGTLDGPWVDEPEPPSSSDPARVAAALLLRRALASSPPEILNAVADGLVCVVVLPSPEWSDIVLEEWRKQVCNHARERSGYRSARDTDVEWIYWTATEPPRPYENRQSSESFALHVAAGRHCIGIAEKLSWLPSDLVASAD